MIQRAAGERARWLAAVLIVTTIAATGMIVQLWPVTTPAPLLASRPIHLYQAPIAPQRLPVVQPVPFVRRVPLQADRVRPASAFAAAQLRRDKKAEPYVPRDARYVQKDVDVAAVDVARLNEPVEPTKDSPQEIAALVIPSAPAVVDVPASEGEPIAAADVVASTEAPLVDVAEAPLPAASSSRGIVEVPAVAVTRAVAIAGRSIMTGLKVTGAILLAPF